MALTLDQARIGSIVDRITEWGEDGKERHLAEIKRGIIVRVDGDPQQESIEGIYVCFGPDTKADAEVEINGTSVPAQRVKASELCEYSHCESLVSKEAWRRLFRMPTNVGVVWENRKAKSGKRRKIVDALSLTAAAEQGPVRDDLSPGGMKMLPESEA